MLASVQVEHEVRERALEPRTQIPIDGEPRPRQLCRAIKIKHSELLAQFPVRLGLKVEFRRRAPAPELDVIFSSCADRNAVVRKVGNARQNVAQAGFKVACDLLFFLYLLAQLLGFVDLRGCVLSRLLEL